MGFQIDQIVLRHIRLPLLYFFETSFGRTLARHIILVQVSTDGVSGWGEVTAGENPFYNEEWTGSIWPLLIDYIGPRVLHHEFAHPAEVDARTSYIRGHKMTRGGMEAAVWDLYSRLIREPLWKTIGGGARLEIPCGVSVGIQNTVEELLERIERELAAGYQRIKIKIKPGWDVDVVRRVRERFPETKLMVDANSAYTLADLEHLKRLDEFGLMMIEQPLAHYDIVDHAVLQEALKTPICLDECIRSAHHAEQAIRLKACRIMNIKLGRVGGFSEARRVHDVCQASGIPVWCGGMLESGIGRGHNIALSTLPNFVLPGDVSASSRYWKQDIIDPPVEVTPRGTIEVPTAPGFGFQIDEEYLDTLVLRTETLR